MASYQADPKIERDLKRLQLRYMTDGSAGLSRKRSGKGFKYFDTNGKLITQKKLTLRIEEMVIPPAWENVWISPYGHTHLQVTGLDERGRKQYIYHEEWVKLSQGNKFSKMLDFSRFLPEIRKRVSHDLGSQILTRPKILAAVVWLLEKTLIRIGNEEYAKENNSFGLTTLRNRHVKVKGTNVNFEFKGKSGVKHAVSISHPAIAKIIKQCIELPGYEIFQFIDESGGRHGVDSSDVNLYLKSITGEDVSAKDFRTWGGTVMGAVCLHEVGSFENETQAKKNVSGAVKKVASHLRNTVAVCRNYYIHPTVISSYQKKVLVPHFEESYKASGKKPDRISKPEFAVITLLHKYS